MRDERAAAMDNNGLRALPLRGDQVLKRRVLRAKRVPADLDHDSRVVVRHHPSTSIPMFIRKQHSDYQSTGWGAPGGAVRLCTRR